MKTTSSVLFSGGNGYGISSELQGRLSAWGHPVTMVEEVEKVLGFIRGQGVAPRLLVFTPKGSFGHNSESDRSAVELSGLIRQEFPALPILIVTTDKLVAAEIGAQQDPSLRAVFSGQTSVYGLSLLAIEMMRARVYDVLVK